MRVEGISVETYGITYVCSEYPEISPNVVTDIGRLVFDPKELCKSDCYTSFEILSNKTNTKWMNTLNSFQMYSSFDVTWLAYRENLFTRAKKLLKSISFRLTTSEVRRYEFNATVNFIWPKFLPSNINFPTLQIDQEAVKFITIVNPTDHMLLVHYVLHNVALHGPKMYTPPSVSKECHNCTLTAENVFSFIPPHETEVFLQDIPPHTYAKIGIRFTANEGGTYSTVLYLRNNLTVVESVWITARAVVPQFKLGNRKSGSQTPLMFEVTDKHLRQCEKPQSAAKPFVAIKRSFTAKNTGEVPITVYAVFIEDQPCSGFGFEVVNCQPFELAPNTTSKVEIEFSPDFTLSRVQRVLYLHTSAGYSVNFTLLGTVPSYSLPICYKAIIRPDWESTYRRASASVLIVAFFIVLVTAFLDSDRILRDHVQNISRDRGPVQPPLDLRQIAASLQHEAINATEQSKPTPPTSGKKKGKVDQMKNSSNTNNKSANKEGSSTSKENLLRNRSKRQNNNSNQRSIQETVTTTVVKPKKEVLEVEETSSESSFNLSDDSDSKHTASTSSPKENVQNQMVKPIPERRTKQQKQTNGKKRNYGDQKTFITKESVTPEPAEKRMNGIGLNIGDAGIEERTDNVQVLYFKFSYILYRSQC